MLFPSPTDTALKTQGNKDITQRNLLHKKKLIVKKAVTALCTASLNLCFQEEVGIKILSVCCFIMLSK